MVAVRTTSASSGMMICANQLPLYLLLLLLLLPWRGDEGGQGAAQALQLFQHTCGTADSGTAHLICQQIDDSTAPMLMSQDSSPDT